MNRILVVAVLLLCMQAATPQDLERHIYWPLVAARTSFENISGHEWTAQDWISTLSFFNAGVEPAHVRIVRSFGGVIVAPPGCLEQPVEVLPGAGFDAWRPVENGGRWGCFVPESPVSYIEFTADTTILPNAEVERVLIKGGCIPANPPHDEQISMGRAVVPVYTELFPARSLATMGEIDLGQPLAQCLRPGEAYIRRVNVTMLNAGSGPARFTVAAIPLNDSPEPLFQGEYTVPANDVLQVNRLPIPLIDSPETRSGRSLRVWLTVTADQPFLCYASSIFETSEPGTLPFEVFPARLVK